jgi:diaminopimelate epimerase
VADRHVRFVKYHGTGNDFVLFWDPDGGLDLDPEAVRALCHRRFGIGADGLIRVAPGEEDTDFFMDYRNADGSEAEMCGNGIRCLARFTRDEGLSSAGELSIGTRAGRKTVRFEPNGQIGVDMGRPAMARAEIPMRGPAWESFVMQPLDAGGHTFRATALSMGNPHLVLLIDGDPSEVAVDRIGPLLERSPEFPEGTNVEFAFARNGELVARVWERGVGETMSCGTGACAVAVAAQEAGLAGATATVRFPGGTLRVSRAEDGEVVLTGPAVRVFEGELVLGD